MNDKNNNKENCFFPNIARTIGFLFSFFVFSAILYNVLSYFNKIPNEWTYFHIGLVVAIVIFFSFLIKKMIRG